MFRPSWPVRQHLGQEYILCSSSVPEAPLGPRKHHPLCPDSVLRQQCSVLAIKPLPISSYRLHLPLLFPLILSISPMEKWHADFIKLNYCYHSNKDILLNQQILTHDRYVPNEEKNSFTNLCLLPFSYKDQNIKEHVSANIGQSLQPEFVFSFLLLVVCLLGFILTCEEGIK